MSCAYHPDREVRGICSSCGRPVCAECLVELSGRPYCKTCLTARMERPAREINGFVRFVLSIAPGVGHLYMGLFNRGLQFFVGTLVGGAILGLVFPGLLALYIPGAIFFSIFDAREIHLRIRQGLDVEDRGFVDVRALLAHWNQRQVGIALIAIGALALWRVLTVDLLRMLGLYHVQRFVNGLALGVLALGAGIWLLWRQQRQQY
ncbi:MAG: hypothetical protein AB2385_10125 [Symbiobacterium sp.]|uniref:hypothetical protein n=1 Tax=Symbiobacterium sp. TaxID=1971213 RepID=UPI003463C17D